jgi:hypothetical protein
MEFYQIYLTKTFYNRGGGTHFLSLPRKKPSSRLLDEVVRTPNFNMEIVNQKLLGGYVF